LTNRNNSLTTDFTKQKNPLWSRLIVFYKILVLRSLRTESTPFGQGLSLLNTQTAER